MNKINLNILEKKAARLFFENKKKTFNIKQVKFFLNVKIDSIYIKDLLKNLFLKKCINIKEHDKYSFRKESVFLTGIIGKRKRKIIDFETYEKLHNGALNNPISNHSNIVLDSIDQRENKTGFRHYVKN